ncbi:MAG: pyridoxamine 5'-phosphate oxidase family protein [Bacteroidota bacterium]
MDTKRDKAIKDIIRPDEIEDIIKRSKVCHIGMTDGKIPYVLGFNFGYKNKTVYIHCSKIGKKIDILKKNSNVCVCFDLDHELFARHENVACSWRLRYKSVLAYGKAEFVEDYDEKVKGLEIFMKNYSDKKFDYNKPSVDNICIIKIPLENMTGRKFEYL